MDDRVTAESPIRSTPEPPTWDDLAVVSARRRGVAPRRLATGPAVRVALAAAAVVLAVLVAAAFVFTLDVVIVEGAEPVDFDRLLSELFARLGSG
jgi:hypothetical protein